MSTLIATELPEGRGLDGEAFPQWNSGGIPRQRVSFLQDAGPLAAESSFASMTSSFMDLNHSKQQQSPSRDSFTAVGSPFSSQQPLSRGSFSTAGDPLSSGRRGVKHVDLRGRGFTQLPAFGKEAGVMSIDLSNNSIVELESAPEDLPESLQVLSLHSNQLSDLCQLKYLTACTSLVDLDILDNPVADAAVRIGFDLRPLMLFLLPRLQWLNGEDVRQARLLEASRKLFTDVQGRLSDRLLEMLDAGRQVELTHYLSQQCPLVKRQRHVDSAPTSPRPAPSSQTLQTLSIDEMPVGSGGRRGVSFSGATLQRNPDLANGEQTRGSSFVERGERIRQEEGDTRGPGSVPGSPRSRLGSSERAVMGSGGFGGFSPVVDKAASPRSPRNRALASNARAVRGRAQENGKQGREASTRNSPRAAGAHELENTRFSTKTDEFSGKAGQKANGNRRSMSKAAVLEAPQATVLGSSEQPMDGGHVAAEPEAERAGLEQEMVKRLVTAEIIATSSSSQIESLAGDVKGRFLTHSKDLSGVRAELSGVRKELQNSRTQGNQELAEVWAELTDVRTELQNSQAREGSARTELGEGRTELAGVRAELADVRAELSGCRKDAGSARAEVATLRTELDEARTEITEVRTELRQMQGRLRAESDARTVLEEALRRMWAECLQLRAWREEEARKTWDRAAGTVQRVWRVWRARREREALSEERRRVEEVLRPHVVRVQALVRGFLQRRRTVELKVQTAAAVRIQALVRGCIQRRKYKKRLWKMQKDGWARQESEALRAQVYQMQLWMHQMATSIAYSAAAPGPPMGYPGQSRERKD